MVNLDISSQMFLSYLTVEHPEITIQFHEGQLRIFEALLNSKTTLISHKRNQGITTALLTYFVASKDNVLYLCPDRSQRNWLLNELSKITNSNKLNNQWTKMIQCINDDHNYRGNTYSRIIIDHCCIMNDRDLHAFFLHIYPSISCPITKVVLATAEQPQHRCTFFQALFSTLAKDPNHYTQY